MVVKELLRDKIRDMQSYDDLKVFLEETALQSKTSKHWINNLIKPIFIILLHIRAEREGEWPLHV